MYNVKGPSKIVAKTTRRGITQNVDNIREYSKNKSVEVEDKEINIVPKPVFHKKFMPNQHRQENISPQHEEIIKFIHDSWNNVVFPESCPESPDSGSNNHSQEVVPCIYYEDEPCSELEGFKPFDLESWWTKHAYAYFTGSSNGKN